MKFKKQLIILLILALSISFIIMDIYAKRKESPVAKVKLVNGKVYWYNKGEKKKNNLKVNQILDLNSVVETLKKSSATLLLKGGAQIELKENSKLILNKSYLKKAQDSISLIKGSASFKIAKLAKNQKVNVYTPTAVVGVRGTEYDIQLASDGSLAVNVEKGDVQVGNDAGSKNVSADQSVETSIENPDLNLKDELKDMKDWAENKDAQVDKDPAGKVVAIKDNLDQANKSQKKVLEALSDDKNAEGEVDQFMFNQARSDGLFESASGIAGKHSKDKKVSRTMSTIKKIYSRLNRLNKILEEKFNKLDQIYEEKSKELDEKMNQFDDKFKDMDKKFDNFEK